MSTIKLIVADWSKVASPKRAENEEKSYDNWTGAGLPILCGCCGKTISNVQTAKSLRIIEGGEYLTEYDGYVPDSVDMGWWYVGSNCYGKFQKNKKEVELTFED